MTYCILRFARSSILTSVAVLASLLLMGSAFAADPTPAPKPAKIQYQLVNITIPSDSPLRNASTINHPPDLYIVVRIKGEPIGKGSKARQGWEVDFESAAQNQWPIWNDGRKIYSIEVWDYSFWGSHEVFSITGLAGSDFKTVIYEKGSVNIPKDRLTTLRFEPVQP
jgi:hypothetical protein